MPHRSRRLEFCCRGAAAAPRRPVRRRRTPAAAAADEHHHRRRVHAHDRRGLAAQHRGQCRARERVGRGFLVARTGNDAFVALTSTCTHQECTIPDFRTSSTSARATARCSRCRARAWRAPRRARCRRSAHPSPAASLLSPQARDSESRHGRRGLGVICRRDTEVTEKCPRRGEAALNANSPPCDSRRRTWSVSRGLFVSSPGRRAAGQFLCGLCVSVADRSAFSLPLRFFVASVSRSRRPDGQRNRGAGDHVPGPREAGAQAYRDHRRERHGDARERPGLGRPRIQHASRNAPSIGP